MSLQSILTIKSHSFVVFAFMVSDLLWRLGLSWYSIDSVLVGKIRFKTYFVIVQNTVKQIVISVFDQISQRCLVGRQHTVLNQCVVGWPLAVVGGGKAPLCAGGVRRAALFMYSNYFSSRLASVEIAPEKISGHCFILWTYKLQQTRTGGVLGAVPSAAV